ncbi:hypothetical protein [Flavobacterium hercynium]|uniref:DUF4595 domain-containing protein n=1 Tax=Flavobacterium hercynium TaxID=387094 RepID=A0A226HJY4_9FLAO|nr:hypothetical protein [Flavobacterium hercynium]OXA93976.1 hypothetical protein B0A66_05605 [Flavobacterium hercynium]SMP36619.1 hypothetical protein SAMN06265346_12316 [Flavobacterium hercynium]
MKVILCCLSVLLLFLSSCSNDDNSSNAKTVLAKNIVSKENGKERTRVFTYDGNKINTVTFSDGLVFKYTYTGDFITKREDYAEKDGKLNSSSELTYENGKLSKKIEREVGSKFYHVNRYIYNIDGTISLEQSYVDSETGIETYDSSEKYTYVNGNLVKVERFFSGSYNESIIEYDTKNSPFKNIIGFNLIVGDETTCSNNVIKVTRLPTEGAKTYLEKYTYKYDKNNYPIEQVITYQLGDYIFSETKQTKFTY